ncbi:hypothetical protein Nitsa_0980 [Nitratifractor salsuginis DSM 16511]|uniref:Uncharacterized protein n=2 Tax=Nitratifractor salsuginis TaxID=269261 RepID=E6X3G2_NITSE|nr:hypothetical protein Nitsa_0980 [Nitratifractor salsuginis DSM 16511]
MPVIAEGTPPTRLVFTFPEDWRVSKFDASSFYRDRVQWLEGMKAVDILAAHDDLLQLIEIKDFRGHSRQNLAKQQNGRLLNDVAKKFVDTFAAMIGAKRLGLEEFAPFYTLLCTREEAKVEVILFLERDLSEKALRHYKLTLADLTLKLRHLMSAYNVRCRVLDRRHLPASTPWKVK